MKKKTFLMMRATVAAEISARTGDHQLADSIAAIMDRYAESEKKQVPQTSSSSEAWNAYAVSFEIRYRTKPIRNATVNAQLANFVRRVGEDLAPKVIAFYVNHRAQFYTQAMHPISLAVRDAEKLAAEFQSGRMVTRTAAAQEDLRGSNADLAARVMRGEV